MNIYITNGSSLDFSFWIYTASTTNVNGVTISAGTDATFSFTGYASVGYTVYGIDSVYGVEEVSYGFTAALDHWQFTIGKDYDFDGAESGSVLSGPDGNWTRHDYYFADANGNITALADTNQSLSAQYRYDPFGNTISKTGIMADTNVYRFSSKEIHLASGMYYYGYRFYDPATQRWVNRDPIQELGFTAVWAKDLQPSRKNEVNLYRMVLGDPANKVDALGLLYFTSPCSPATQKACAATCAAQGLPVKACDDYDYYTQTDSGFYHEWGTLCQCGKPPPPPPPKPDPGKPAPWGHGPPNCSRNGPPPIIISYPPTDPPWPSPIYPPGGGRYWPFQ